MSGEIVQGSMDPLEAHRSLMRFASRRGQDALMLAMHAAVPQGLRADLLHLLRTNFVPEAEHGYATEADVLFAPWCESLGDGYFEIEPEVRRQLLDHLATSHPDEGIARVRHVARFLLAWVDQLEHTIVRYHDAVFVEFLEMQRWVADAFIDPARTAEQFANALSDVEGGSGRAAARFRVGGVAAAIALPLRGEQQLLAFARMIDERDSGNEEGAKKIRSLLPDDGLVVGDVKLELPSTLAKREEPPAAETKVVAVQSEEQYRSPGTALGWLPSRPEVFVGRRQGLDTAIDWITFTLQIARPLILIVHGPPGVGKLTFMRQLVGELEDGETRPRCAWIKGSVVSNETSRRELVGIERFDVLFVDEIDDPRHCAFLLRSPQPRVIVTAGARWEQIEGIQTRGIRLDPFEEGESRSLVRALSREWTRRHGASEGASDPLLERVLVSGVGLPIVIRMATHLFLFRTETEVSRAKSLEGSLRTIVERAISLLDHRSVDLLERLLIAGDLSPLKKEDTGELERVGLVELIHTEPPEGSLVRLHPMIGEIAGSILDARHRVRTAMRVFFVASESSPLARVIQRALEARGFTIVRASPRDSAPRIEEADRVVVFGEVPDAHERDLLLSRANAESRPIYAITTGRDPPWTARLSLDVRRFDFRDIDRFEENLRYLMTALETDPRIGHRMALGDSAQPPPAERVSETIKRALLDPAPRAVVIFDHDTRGAAEAASALMFDRAVRAQFPDGLLWIGDLRLKGTRDELRARFHGQCILLVLPDQAVPDVVLSLIENEPWRVLVTCSFKDLWKDGVQGVFIGALDDPPPRRPERLTIASDERSRVRALRLLQELERMGFDVRTATPDAEETSPMIRYGSEALAAAEAVRDTLAKLERSKSRLPLHVGSIKLGQGTVRLGPTDIHVVIVDRPSPSSPRKRSIAKKKTTKRKSKSKHKTTRKPRKT